MIELGERLARLQALMEAEGEEGEATKISEKPKGVHWYSKKIGPNLGEAPSTESVKDSSKRKELEECFHVLEGRNGCGMDDMNATLFLYEIEQKINNGEEKRKLIFNGFINTSKIITRLVKKNQADYYSTDETHGLKIIMTDENNQISAIVSFKDNFIEKLNIGNGLPECLSSTAKKMEKEANVVFEAGRLIPKREIKRHFADIDARCAGIL